MLRQGWSWENVTEGPAAAEAMAGALEGSAAHRLTDLRLMLRLEHELAPDVARVLSLVERHRLQLIVFSNRAARARALFDTDPVAFAAMARKTGADADAMKLTLDALAPTAAAIPRALCRLAERFDELGLLYGSMEDDSAEAREHHSMIGAGLCMTPLSTRASAAARAVSDPVVLSGREVFSQMRTETLDPSRIERCNALVSDGAQVSLAEIVLQLVSRGLIDLPRAWALISDNPARLLRLTDRGRLDKGMRADLAIINRTTLRVEATICGGKLAYLAGEAGQRFLGHGSNRDEMALAAE